MVKMVKKIQDFLSWFLPGDQLFQSFVNQIGEKGLDSDILMSEPATYFMLTNRHIRVVIMLPYTAMELSISDDRVSIVQLCGLPTQIRMLVEEKIDEINMEVEYDK